MWSHWLDQVRTVYDARARIPFDGHTNAKEVDRCVGVVSRVAPALDSRVCDIGCGTGWHLKELAQRGYSRLYGLDVSLGSLEIAAQRCADTPAIFIWGDVGAAGLTAAFDVVTIFGAALGSGSRDYDLTFLRSAASLLANDGTLVLSYIPLELASRHVGTFDVAYCVSSAVTVSSDVKLRSDLGVLEIRQKIGETVLPTEELCLYSEKEMTLLMEQAGMVIAPSSLSTLQAERLECDDYLGWMIARRCGGQH